MIDPLDGTINFLFGIPQFAVSVACEDCDGGLVGVVLDPVRESASPPPARGPPELNGQVIAARVAATSSGPALVATGFGYDAEVRERQAAVLAPGAAPGARHPPRRGGRPGSGLVRLRALRRLLRARPQALGRAAGGLIAARAGLERAARCPSAVSEPEGLLVAPPAVVDELLELVARAGERSARSVPPVDAALVPGRAIALDAPRGGGGTVDTMPSKGIVLRDVWVRIPLAA